MASIIDIKRRKASVESTGQITKAMKLVSTVKLQRAKQRADESKAYFNKMYETVSSILPRQVISIIRIYRKMVPQRKGSLPFHPTVD